MKEKFINKESLEDKDIVNIKKGKIVLKKIKSFTNTTCKLIATTVPIGSFIFYYPVKTIWPLFFLKLEENSCLLFLIYCLAVAGSIHLYEENEKSDLNKPINKLKYLRKDKK